MDRILTLFSRLMPLWVVLLGIVGFICPNLLLPCMPYMKYFFMVTMVGVGLLLDPRTFLPVLKKPQLVLLGSLTQFTVMPLLGWTIGRLFDFPPAVTFGFVLVGVVPGAMASNVIAYLAGADVAYSIAITTLSTFLAPVVSPLLTELLAGRILAVDFWEMCRSILLLVVGPLGVGMVLHHFLGKAVKPFKAWFPAMSTLAIAVICASVVVKNRDLLVQLSGLLCLAVVLHNALGFLGGWAGGFSCRLPGRMRRTLCLEVGMQNAGLGALLAAELFDKEPGVALPSALFASWCVVTASLLAVWWRWRDQRRQTARR